jgi:choline-glycine betaine transporter
MSIHYRTWYCMLFARQNAANVVNFEAIEAVHFYATSMQSGVDI